MDFKNITIFPEFIEDAILYVLIAIALCFLSKIIHDWKEKRRLSKEMAAYWQMKSEEDEA